MNSNQVATPAPSRRAENIRYQNMFYPFGEINGNPLHQKENRFYTNAFIDTHQK